MPLPPDYERESLYGPEAWFVHDLLEVDAEHVLAVMDTTRLGALVDAQRVLPGHPKHVPGAVAIQATGTLGSLHAVYGLGLRISDGWFGFGTHITNARFTKIGQIGPPVELRLTATRVRRFRDRLFAKYSFAYAQSGEPIYESEQIAVWGREAP